MAASKTANKTAATTAEAPKAPALNFDALTVSDVAEMPKRTGNEKVRQTPVWGWMNDSKTNGTAKRVTVPEANVKQIENLIRQAANALNCGARIVVGEKDSAGNVAVTFTAKERRAYKPRAKKN